MYMPVMFMPIGDDNTDRQRFPYVTMLLVAINVIAFLLELSTEGAGQLEAFVRQWAVIPADYTRGAGIGGPVPFTLLSAMFLHAGWAHIFGNMLYLWIFGDNVESVFGHVRYLVFYLVTGAVASAAHILASPGSTVPSLGASGAISGVLAAYLVMFPRRSVYVMMGLRRVAVPAIVVIGMWAVFQFLSGAGSILAPREGGGVAYVAHVGGFVAGLLLTPLLRGPRARDVLPRA
jgi:membrane associated rhomboid family serine protease